MSIGLTSEASLDLAALQSVVKEQESTVSIRLTSLAGKKESGFSFNAHQYSYVVDDSLPLSSLFAVGGSAADDPVVKTWLAQHPGQRVLCENEVYVSGSPARIAVVGKPD